MPIRAEPREVQDARQRVTEAKLRVARQERRVASMKREGRNASRAEMLLEDDDLIRESPATAAERARQFATIKELLTATELGTS
jgi:hypothetical protein